ncbi:MAG: DUF5716 family protein [Lachnospiraceae bacterium]|nr:DUF5716 family protein [Lachnospiraceae bacterium]
MASNVFDRIPSGFFNLLSSGSDNINNAGCLLEIYTQYDMEVSYRIGRKILRDALALYILENNLSFSEEDADEKSSDVANSIIRKFTDEECGWLTEETDDATYEKYIIMTEAGIALSEFLLALERPEKVEYSSYIYNIYNTLMNSDQWKSDPYVNAVKAVYNNAKALAKSLKRLSTFIRKKIEELTRETSLEVLTEHLLEYCDGDFIREYARLTKQQNIHMYRSHIRSKLDEIVNNQEMHELIVCGCAIEENISEDSAEEFVLEMVDNTKKFLNEDYDRIMRDIKHKINMHIHIAVGRIRFIRNSGKDAQGNVEQVLKLLRTSIDEGNLLDELSDEMTKLYRFDKNEYIDTASLWSPRKSRVIKKAVTTETEILTQADKDDAITALEKEAYNPYSKKKMKLFLEERMRGKDEIDSAQLPLSNKTELLSDISAVAYCEENGFEITVEDGYLEANDMILRRFKIRRKVNGV